MKIFFLYFEETDYCFRANKKNLFSYQLNNIKITHNVGTSIEYNDEKEETKIRDLRNWHYIWSKFYFYKKHKGYMFSIIVFLPILIRTIIKKNYYKITKNQKKKRKYEIRYQGLISSIDGKNSYKRI